MKYKFTLPVAPRTKKNSPRAVKVGGFTKVLPSKAYCDYFKAAMGYAILIRTQLRDQGAMLPIRKQVIVTAYFYLDANRAADVNGLQQALGDWMQETIASKKHPGKTRRVGAGIIGDDVQIKHWGDSQIAGVDRAFPRTEVTIEVLG